MGVSVRVSTSRDCIVIWSPFWHPCGAPTTICVDSSEFVVSKLKDRGTHQAFGVVTNAQDFMHILRLFVERELDARGAPVELPRNAAPR